MHPCLVTSIVVGLLSTSAKKGLYSVNFTNDTNNFIGMTEKQLVDAILTGKFRDRGTIRMLPLTVKANAQRNAFSPQFYKKSPVKGF